MRLAGGAPANSAIAERKPDRAFGFSEGVAAGLNPLVASSALSICASMSKAVSCIRRR